MVTDAATPGIRKAWRTFGKFAIAAERAVARQSTLLGALAMREMITRFGRRNLGFLWIIGEPLLFAGGVLFIWSLIKPPYEHGVKLAPFVMTGYLPLLLIRHGMSRAAQCISANIGLLYHRQISVFHLLIARLGLEFAGIGVAFLACFSILWAVSAVEPPKQLELVYLGWILLCWFVLGMGLVIGALSELSEVVERVVGLLSYAMIPISGAFFMVGWLPEAAREVALFVPMVHCFELIRAGFFGEFIPTFYDPAYVALWSLCLTFIGLCLLGLMRRHIEVE